MSALLNFLNRVLPLNGEGHRCYVAIKDKQVRQGFCANNADLESLLRGIDSRQWNAFFSCATYKEPTNRTGENASFAKSFWLDIDAGKGKTFSDIDTAGAALSRFCDDTGLFYPSIRVCSGNGLHAYWVLGAAVECSQWLPVAKKLKELTRQHDFDADPARTADRASILRPIETLNWKDPEAPKEVYILEENDDIDFNTFREIIFREAKPAVRAKQPLAIKDNGLSAAIVGGLGNIHPNMQQGYGDGERTNELTLRAGWCLGPDQMTEAETIAACLEWNQYNEPPLNEDKVVKTVESLAKRETQKRAEVTTTLPAEEPEARISPPLPYGFKYGKNYEIVHPVKDPNSEPGEPKFLDIVVCKYPFFVSALREEETSGVAGNQSIKITRRTMHSPWKSFVVPRREILSNNWRAALGAYGVVCEPRAEKAFSELIHKMIQWREDTGMTDVSYKSFGWKHNREGFVAGRRYYQRGKITDISGTVEFEKAADLMCPRPRGSINKWRAAAARVFAPGCEAQALAMLASFAAPLMDLLYAGDEGGAIMSLVSSKSGQGKTAAILAAETVWGQTNCLRITERESAAAQFRAIGVRCNMPVVIDEWGNTDIDSVRDRVATFTGGLDKKRLAMSGEDNREQLHWKTVMIGTTNLAIVDMLHQSNYSAQAARIFEIPVNIPAYLAHTQAADLNQEFEDNAGFAGPVFLAYLLNNFNLDEMRIRVNAMAEEFGRRVHANTEERFKTRMMAGIAMVAVILANPMINGEPMIEFNPARIVNFGLDIIREGKKTHVGRKSSVAHLMDFIKDNMHNFVVVDEPFNPKKTYLEFDAVLPKQKLMGRYEQKNKKLFIPHDTMHKFAVSIRIPYKEFSKELAEVGLVLNRNRQTHLTAGCVKLTPVRLSCWEIDLSHDSAGEVQEGLEVEAEKLGSSPKLKGK